jgi:hypothetical protein
MACPRCGASAEPGQLICLGCGSRLALDYRRPRGWTTPVAIVVLVLLAAGAALGAFLWGVFEGAEDEVASVAALVATG